MYKFYAADEKETIVYGAAKPGYSNEQVNKVCSAPIQDFHLASKETLIQIILPFLNEAFFESEKVVVHCGGGIGRTGHVLAAWLVHSRAISNREAIAAIKKTGRNPYEAAIAAPFYGRNPWKVMRELNVILDKCRNKH